MCKLFGTSSLFCKNFSKLQESDRAVSTYVFSPFSLGGWLRGGAVGFGAAQLSRKVAVSIPDGILL
jgi:hypothetical protein